MSRPWDDPSSPWRTTEECACYLRRFHRNGTPDRAETVRVLERLRVRKRRIGRTLLYDRQEVEACVAPVEQ